jgi:hypothetical protein
MDAIFLPIAHGIQRHRHSTCRARFRFYRELESKFCRLWMGPHFPGFQAAYFESPLDIREMIAKMLAKIGRCCWGIVFGGTTSSRRRIHLSSVRPALFTLAILLIAVIVACSGNAPTHTLTQPAITVSISPTSATLAAGGTQAFAPTVQNTADTNVTWYVNQVNGGGSATGTITSTGLYTAPSVASQATFTITAVADANTSISASASVTVTPIVSVTVNPHNAAVETAHTLQFSATVVNTTNTAVTWQVNGVAGGNTTAGTIDANGLYTAPGSIPSPATVTVTAISVADPTKSDSASVTISLTPVLTVNPLQAIVVVANQQQFTANISGLMDQSVNWGVSGTGCSGAQCGTIDTNGLYTAPASVPNPAAVTVTATSQADNSVTGTATVTVIAQLGVTISPPGPITIPLSGTQVFTATVVGDPSNSGVTWNLTCVSDVENPPDCAGSGSNDGDPDVSTISGMGFFSVTFNAAPGPSGGGLCDENSKDCVLTLTATTKATGGSGAQTATVTITVP